MYGFAASGALAAAATGAASFAVANIGLREKSAAPVTSRQRRAGILDIVIIDFLSCGGSFL
jgi:hypothetical protein